MLEINVNVHFPDLPQIEALLKSWISDRMPADAVPAPAEAAPAPAEPVQEKPDVITPPAPVAPVAAPVAATAPVAPAAPVAAPAVTREQVARAGADLLTSNPGMRPQLETLIKKYGKTLMDVPADQLSSFAAELRGLGAKV